MNGMMPAPPDPAPPRLGRYRLLERLGGGATSIVYAAHDEGAERDVALKVIAAELANEREARERFYREAMVTSEVRHRNIVAVLDIGEDQGRAYIVMERLRGLPLDDYLRVETAQSLTAKIDLMTQLYEGLHAAHQMNVVHRDIKPSNLFVQDDGCLKILDFGLARLQASTLTAHGQILGTPDFMSPEQAEGRRVDARSDIFSAAAVSYRMFSGRAPFARGTLQKTLVALLESSPAALTDREAPEPLRRLLAVALARSPDDRYPRAADVLNDLGRIRTALDQPAVWRRLASYVGVARS
jgi:eukaryotic-like serine/threonine-protein kinase